MPFRFGGATMTEPVKHSELLRRCASLPAQHATNAQNRATADATPAQQPSLKALALRALGRNSARNTHATDAEKPRNNDVFLEGGLLREIRSKLERFANDALFNPLLVRDLHDEDVAACAGLSDDALSAYVHMLRDTDLRSRGRAPADETAWALCRHCGPVWVHPAVASAAPVVGGWPHMLGCPWCHVRNRDAITRPLVTCGECLHFIRDLVNPGGGMGTCGAGCDPARPLPYPNALRQCATWRAKNGH